MSRSLDAHVIITNPNGTFHAGDVVLTHTSARQDLHDSPVALTDPQYAFAWAADTAFDRSCRDGIIRDVWLIIAGGVADHAHINR